MNELLNNFIASNPQLVSILVVIGALRAIFKPLFSVVQAYVDYTVDPADNEKLKKFTEGRIYKAIAYILDYSASIKLPQAPKPVATAVTPETK